MQGDRHFMKISRVSEMKQLDQAAIRQFGISDEILMENAGLAVCTVIQNELGVAGKRFVVFCGPGNNGGDGFVIARKLHSNGGRVKIYLAGPRGKYQGAAAANLAILERIALEITAIDRAESVKPDVFHCDAVVDALLGTGLTKNIEGLFRDIVMLVNAAGKTVFSVDIPSGVNGDTGKIMGAAVQADFTIAFGLPKVGNLLYPGFDHCGKLFVSHICFPPSLYRDFTIETNDPLVLPRRNPCFHKGDFGNLLCIAGAAGYFGAPYFSALSFLKAGGGYSRLAAPGSITPFIAAKGSEIVFLPQEETDAGSLSLKNKKSLLAVADQMDIVILGPGMSLNEETQTLSRDLAREIGKPLLIDGDGITAVCKDLDIIRQRRTPTILTPHLGEMAKITQTDTGEIDDNKIDIVQQTARNLNAFIVLKGPHSLIGCPDGKVFVNLSGNSGMATAGAGDALTGTIAAMHTLGLGLESAVRKGVHIHGLAGDLAAADKGEDGMTAQDILDFLPLALKADRNGLMEPPGSRYRGACIL
jgi:ADP-dependent NAD(P)H-hydrate dehydratase / NAD(P)H-hydrate epimerase